MDWLTGMLTGYGKRSREIEQDKMLAARDASAREGKVFEALLQSSDPQIRALAGTGLIHAAQPNARRKGIAGWMGEMESNPIYPKLLEYMNTPQTKTRDVPVPGLPATKRYAGYYPTTGTAGMGPMALPDSSPTEKGAPGLTPPTTEPPPAPPPSSLPPNETNPADRFEPPRSIAQPLPEEPPLFGTGAPPPPPPAAEPPSGPFGGSPQTQAALTEAGLGPPPAFTAAAQEPQMHVAQPDDAGPAVGRVDQETYSELPHAFPTSADLFAQRNEAEILGDVEAYTKMFIATGKSPQEAHKLAADLVAAKHTRGTGAPFQSARGVITNPDGTQTVVFGSYNKYTGQTEVNGEPRPDFVPIPVLSTGQYFEQAAQFYGYERGSMVPPAAMPMVVKKSQELQYGAGYANRAGGFAAEYNKPATFNEAQTQGRPTGSTSADFAGQTPTPRPDAANRLVLGYYNRAKQAVDTIGTPQLGTSVSLEDRIARQNMLGQFQGRYAPNVAMTNDQQLYRQAQRAFTEARLRRESGAAVPPFELINDANTYFAVPGDSPQTIAQKRVARNQVLDGLAYGAGPAYQEYYGKPYVSPLSATPNAAPFGAAFGVPNIVGTPPPAAPPTTVAPPTAAPPTATRPPVSPADASGGRAIRNPDGSWSLP